MVHKKIFEEWLKVQYGNDVFTNLSFDSKNGYSKETVNAMWIGFNAGITLMTYQGESIEAKNLLNEVRKQI